MTLMLASQALLHLAAKSRQHRSKQQGLRQAHRDGQGRTMMLYTRCASAGAGREGKACHCASASLDSSGMKSSPLGCLQAFFDKVATKNESMEKFLDLLPNVKNGEAQRLLAEVCGCRSKSQAAPTRAC